MMNRPINCILGIVAGIIFFIPLAIISLIIRITTKEKTIFASDRVGKNNKIFKMYKFKTMWKNTPDVATHLLENPDQYITPVGKLLRKTSLDELPQIFNIIKCDMNFVGPRPALHNQYDLIELRTKKGIHGIAPGITGWAQVNGRDELSIPDKVECDEYYLKNKSWFLDIKIIFMTFVPVLKTKGVDH